MLSFSRCVTQHIHRIGTRSIFTEVQNTQTVVDHLNKKGNCVIQFSARWCMPCRQITPKVEGLGETYSTPIFYVDVDEHAELRDENNIDVVPTFVVFEGGKATQRIQGGKLDEVTAALKKMEGK